MLVAQLAWLLRCERPHARSPRDRRSMERARVLHREAIYVEARERTRSVVSGRRRKRATNVRAPRSHGEASRHSTVGSREIRAVESPSTAPSRSETKTSSRAPRGSDPSHQRTPSTPPRDHPRSSARSAASDSDCSSRKLERALEVQRGLDARNIEPHLDQGHRHAGLIWREPYVPPSASR